MSNLNETRRRFMSYFAGIGLGSTLAPGVVWARMQDAGAQTITMGMITEARHANEIVQGGDADLVFLARELLREPYWALKAQRELGGEPAWPVQYLRAR